jgi:hypothetical protein
MQQVQKMETGGAVLQETSSQRRAECLVQGVFGQGDERLSAQKNSELGVLPG